MDNVNQHPLIKYPALRSGVSLFSSGLLICAVGRYMKVDVLPLNNQLKAFSIAAVAQTILHMSLGKNKDWKVFFSQEREILVEANIFNTITPIALIAVASKYSRFKSLAIATSLISIGYFGLDCCLKHIGKALKTSPPPVIPSPPESPREKIYKFEEFEELLLSGYQFPDKPILIEESVYLGTNASPNREKVTYLPENLTVMGTLDLSGCKNLISLPATLKVKDFLNLACCEKIKEIPEALEFGESLNVDGCRSLIELPQNLNVRGNLDISNCKFEYLPRNLKIQDWFYVHDCPNLKELPEDLKKMRGLNLTGSTLITSLPEDLHIGTAGLRIHDCPNLKALPKGLRIEGDLILHTPIETLPDNLYIGGNLVFEKECKATITLPQGLHIGRTLRVEADCLTSLPEDMIIDKDIILRGCYSLKTLPSWMYQIETSRERERHINVEETSISREEANRLKTAYKDKPYMRIYFPTVFGDPNIQGSWLGYDFMQSLNPFESEECTEARRLLGLEENLRPTNKQIKKAYRDLSLIHHPDKPTGNTEMFQKIKSAYEKLMEVL